MARSAAASACSRRDAGLFARLRAQGSKTAPNIKADWGKAKAATEESMKMLQMYKDLGDFEGQVRARAARSQCPQPVPAAVLVAATQLSPAAVAGASSWLCSACGSAQKKGMQQPRDAFSDMRARARCAALRCAAGVPQVPQPSHV